jgi:hypothetical protein
MQFADFLALGLVLLAAVSFYMGESALSGAEDLHAIYWLVVGIVSLRAAVQVARPAEKA